MFEVTTESSFSAAHHLKNYGVPCENTHGHNWLVKATVKCEKLNEIGIGIDFRKLRSSLQAITEELDHTDLNDIFDRLDLNPSSENIARYIFKKLSAALGDSEEKVARIDVMESPGSSAAYYE
ncbi:MAG: 6-carboxytetrahydropterin synthase QueD [Chitinivibrionales bacterium]|nr:6-carboxytetrahydropterin synthase QueD [Chitinivibrionales bacterium]